MTRHAGYPIEPAFTARTSPRAFTGAAMPTDDLMTMFEAARWAPSSSNVQPWRFIYALRDTPEWGPLFEALMPGNQAWANRAAALVVIVSDLYVVPDGQRRVSSTHGFDTGAAWMQLALQAHAMGYATHAMGGFSADRARAAAGVPEEFHIDCMVAVGKPADPATLSAEQQAREAPNDRRPLNESVFHARFAAG